MAQTPLARITDQLTHFGILGVLNDAIEAAEAERDDRRGEPEERDFAYDGWASLVELRARLSTRIPMYAARIAAREEPARCVDARLSGLSTAALEASVGAAA